MLLGDIFYYRLGQDGRLHQLAECDFDTPCRLNPPDDGVAVWVCTNGPRERRVEAGAKVLAKFDSPDAILAALPS